MDALKESYVSKCRELCCEPIAPFIDVLNDAIQTGSVPQLLALNGNSKVLFHNRISPLQLMALCETLANDDHFEFLDLSYNDATPAKFLGDAAAATFGDKGAETVARMLRSNRSLRYLILEGNAIGAAGAQHLATALSAPGGGGAGIQALNIASNGIGDAGAAAMADMLQNNCTLRMLDVGSNGVGVSGLLALCNVLTRHNTTLQTLGIEDCAVKSPPQDQTVRFLASMFAINTTLKQIYLAKQGLRDCDFELLVDYGLTKNCSLEVLDLRGNRLSGMCAPSLARLLTECPSLKVLNLSHNRIRDECAAALAETIPFNRSLVELDVRHCSMTDAGMAVLAKALMNSGTVSKVMVWGNGFGVHAAGAWRDLALQMQNDGAQFLMDVEPYEVDEVPMIAFANEDL